MDLDNITLEKFLKNVTYSSDTDPGNKLVISNGMFVQCIIHLKLIDEIIRLRGALK